MSKGKAEILKGTLDMLILRSLSQGSKHGYGIAQWLAATSQELLQIEQGSLYPALYRMEDRGWIQAEWGLSELQRRAKLYSLTPEGRRRLAREEEEWERLVRAVGLVLRPEARTQS